MADVQTGDESPPEIRLAVQSTLLPGATLHERYENARSYGFDGMELAAPPMRASAPTPAPMLELAAEALRDGVPVTAMCSGHRGWLIDPDPDQISACIEDAKRLLELGAQLQVPLIVVPIVGRTALHETCRTGRSPDEDERLWLGGLRVLSEHADRVGGRLLVEAINRYQSPVCNRVADAARAARLMTGGRVHAMADAYHMNIEERELGDALESVADMLGYVHVADTNRLQPGQGHMPWDRVFGALVRMGYRGYVSLECTLSATAEQALPQAARFLRSRIAAARLAQAGR